MNTRSMLISITTLLCMGCANISTLSRTTALPSKSAGSGSNGDGTGPKFNTESGGYGSGDIAIHLDAPQRVVLAKPGFVCSEPSPDALQAYASALGFGINLPGAGGGSAAQALATSAGSIGLRTNAITVLRDHLYNLCLASYNGTITGLDVSQQLRQTQDLALGALAIEQLTGVVTARQVVIGTSASASASTNLIDTKAALNRAREDEQAAKDTLSKATAARAKQQTAVGNTTDALAQEKNDAEKTRLTAELTRLKTQLAEDQQAEKTAQVSYFEAQKVTSTIKSNFDTASTSATASAQGKGEFSQGNDSYKVNADTVKEVSGAVERIVSVIIKKRHLTESCIGIMNKFAKLESRIEETVDPQLKRFATADQKALKPLHNMCQQVFEADVKTYFLNAENGTGRVDGVESVRNSKPPHDPGEAF